VPFEVIPSIDLRDGRCVRLLHGDFARETVYSDDPVAIARRWEREGARRLHVVDLDASRDGTPRNHAVVAAIIAALQIPVQVAGGIRDEPGARALLSAGADRVVLGTAAVQDPALVQRLAQRDPERLIVALDARDGFVRTDGWTQDSGVRVLDLAHSMLRAGVCRFLYTDIARDGALEGPNITAYAELCAAIDAAVQASGGVASVADIVALTRTGAEGVVVGRALYTGGISLPEALAAVADSGR